ncbi:MAG: hypothetical protein QM589_06275 [Thermomicrobiales bacterium]
MSDRDSIFTADDTVEQEIEANEERDLAPKEPAYERAINAVISPLTRLMQDNELTPEEAEEANRENDREHQPE